MDWSQTNVTSTIFVCWAALAAAWHFYQIPKITRQEKLFGVFEHINHRPNHPLLRGGDDVFYAPHSRNGDMDPQHVKQHPELLLIADSEQVGPYLFASKDNRQVFVLGHAEYDPLCLKREYDRDEAAGLNPNIPTHYYPDNDPHKDPVVKWRSHGNLMFSNWLNYFVYQKTPFKRHDIGV
jgi:homoserine O-succinyltransferase